VQRAIERLGLVYGCTASVLSIVWYFVAVFGPPVQWPGAVVIATISTIHLMNVGLVLTPIYLSPWQPIIEPTPTRLRIARWTLSVALLAVLIHLLVVLLLLHSLDVAVRIRSITTLLSSCAVLTSILITTAWTLSYERVVPRWVDDARHPLRPLLVALIKWRSKRRAKNERDRRLNGH
jgi:hypothetical protein